MTKSEAIELIKRGSKLTHTYFTDDEYIHLVKGVMTFEDDVRVPDDWWEKDYLKDGWRLHHLNDSNMQEQEEKQIKSYVVLGAGITKEKAQKTLAMLAIQTGNVGLINTVNSVGLITEEEAKDINSDLFPIEQYEEVVSALKSKVINDTSLDHDEVIKNTFGGIPRRIRRAMMKGPKVKRAIKKLSTVNYIKKIN